MTKLTSDTMIKLIEQLRHISRTRNSPALTGLVETTLADEKFIEWPASIDKHHSYQHGLLKHTIEVMSLCIANWNVSDTRRFNDGKTPINLETVLISALLHDYGKVYTYNSVHHDKNTNMSRWGKTPEYTKSLHIYKSIDKAHECLDGVLDEVQLQDVIHCIGAHHGRIDYGSLWEPKTPEAWVLHLADMASVFCIANKK